MTIRIVTCPACHTGLEVIADARPRCTPCATPVGDWEHVEDGMVRRNHIGHIVERRSTSSGRAGCRRGTSGGGLAPELTPCVEQHPHGAKTTKDYSRTRNAKRRAV